MGLSNFFSSLFGKAKEKAEIAKENLSEVAENVAEKAVDVAEDVKETVENVAEKVSDKLEEMGVPEKVNEPSFCVSTASANCPVHVNKNTGI